MKSVKSHDLSHIFSYIATKSQTSVTLATRSILLTRGIFSRGDYVLMRLHLIRLVCASAQCKSNSCSFPTVVIISLGYHSYPGEIAIITTAPPTVMEISNLILLAQVKVCPLIHMTVI